MLTSIFSIVAALLPIAVNALESFKTISPTTGSLINAIGGATTAFASEVTVNGPSVTATTILAAISAALTVLKSELPTNGTASAVLLYITAIESAIAAGLAATSITSVDATKLAPVIAA
jgi:hypothetical protein